MNIEVRKICESSTVETKDAVDAEVLITTDTGEKILGDVTLVPAEYDGRLSSWGSLDHWASQPLHAWIRDEEAEDRAENRAGHVVDAVRRAAKSAGLA
jgi:hypothetical protein